MDSLGQENLIFLQLDINLNFTWHFMFFLYLGITYRKHLINYHSILLVCTVRVCVIHHRFSGTNLDGLLCRLLTVRTIEVYNSDKE